MLNLFNIFPIVKEHFKTLKKDSSILVIIIFFLIIPSFLAGILCYYKINLDRDIINTLLTVFAIFIGFIINVIVLLIDRLDKTTGLKLQLVKHAYHNSLYQLLVGIIILILSFSFILLFNSIGSFGIRIFSTTICFLIINFLISLLLIIKRFFVILVKS